MVASFVPFTTLSPSLASILTLVKSAKQCRRTSAPEKMVFSQLKMSAFPMSSGGINDSVVKSPYGASSEKKRST
tara:strand:- start:10352 stop:10573 length:222 start_codon:yes stop_codon:yes gene_type:complete